MTLGPRHLSHSIHSSKRILSNLLILTLVLMRNRLQNVRNISRFPHVLDRKG